MSFSTGIHVRFVVKGSPAHVSTPVRGSRHHSLVSGRLSDHHPGEGPGLAVVVSRCLSTTGIGFLGTLSRREVPPRLLSAYHHRTRVPAHAAWTQTRVYHVPHAWDPDRAGRSL